MLNNVSSVFFGKSKYSVSIKASFYYFFLILVFFPYLQILPTGTDMQPFALLSAIGLFFLFNKRFSNTEVWLLFMLIASMLLLAIGSLNLLAIRSFMNYLSLFFISYIAYRVLRSGRVKFESFLLFTFFIWFLVSLIQALVDNNFLTFLVSGSRTTADRGVTGLAPEPTFLGIVFIFYILFSLHLSSFKFRKLIIFLSIVGILFLAKSAMALLFLLIMVGFYFVTYANMKSFAIIAFGFFLFTYLINFLEGSRIYRLFDLVKNEPTTLLLVDASINDRFFHVFFSVKGFFQNFLIPNGYEAWLPYVTNQLIAYQDVVIVEWFSLGGRIMSGYGGAFFELGIFFLIVPFVLTYLLFKIYRSDMRRFLFYSVFINTIMFAAIPVGFPFFAFYIGLLSFLLYEKKRENIS